MGPRKLLRDRKRSISKKQEYIGKDCAQAPRKGESSWNQGQLTAWHREKSNGRIINIREESRFFADFVCNGPLSPSASYFLNEPLFDDSVIWKLREWSAHWDVHTLEFTTFKSVLIGETVLRTRMC